MTNPDRVELGLQPTLVPENPKKNGFIPRWLRVPAFAIRASLAILTATPGMVITADVIARTVNPSVVYASGGATGKLVRIERLEDCKWDIKMEATGFRPGIPISVITFNDGNEYNCPGGDKNINYQAAKIDSWKGVGVADSNGHIFFDIIQNRYGSFRYQVFANTITAADHDAFWINVSYSRDQIPINTPRPTIISIPTATPTFTNEQIEIKKRAGLLPTDTPIGTPTPRPTPEIRPTQVMPIVPTPTTEIPDWLWGLGAAFLAGLTANEIYKRLRSRRGTSAGATAGTAGGTGSSTPPIFRIGGIIGAIGGPSNPNTAPSTGPTQQKNPEWITGQEDFERRWQAAKSKLSPVRPGDTGNEYDYILDRFKAAMNIVHEMSLDNNAIQVPKMAVRIRAGMEYVIPEVWPDNKTLRRFFDPGFNAGYFTPEDFAKMVYLPEIYRSLSRFNKAQRGDIRRIHRILLHALHPDLLKSDADPKVQDSIDDLFKRFNPAWPYIENLIKLTP